MWLEAAGRRDAADEACIALWGPHALLADPDYEGDAAAAAALVSNAAQQLRGLGRLGAPGAVGGHGDRKSVV